MAAEFPAALEEALQGRLSTQRRGLLQAELWRQGRCQSRALALNDIVVAKGALGRLVALEAEVDGKPLTAYLADGLIVATPTGSTAYALSAGGPLLQPGLPCLVLAPIAPHSLSHRPLVIADRSTVTVRVPRSGEGLVLSADGQCTVTLKRGDEVRIKRSRLAVSLLVPRGLDWRETLRSKLGWRGN
jgi:NAD+ kinase